MCVYKKENERRERQLETLSNMEFPRMEEEFSRKTSLQFYDLFSLFLYMVQTCFLVFILHLLQPKGRRQGGNVLHSYWRRTMVRRAKNSTHADSVQGACVWCILCSLANQYFVLFSWLEFSCNVTKSAVVVVFVILREAIHVAFGIVHEYAS